MLFPVSDPIVYSEGDVVHYRFRPRGEGVSDPYLEADTLPLGANTPSQRQTPPRGRHPLRKQTPPPQVLTSSGDHQNRRYASYCNAFLLLNISEGHVESGEDRSGEQENKYK